MTDQLSSPASSVTPSREVDPSRELVRWMRRKASILRKPCPFPCQRAYDDEDVAAFAQALEDGARALEVAEREVASLLAIVSSPAPAPPVPQVLEYVRHKPECEAVRS